MIIATPIIKQFEANAPRGNALDIGAGRGDNAIFLANQGFTVDAVEIRKNLADAIKENSKENNVNLNIINKDARYFNIEKKRYSLISAINSLNFFSKKDFQIIIKKIKDGLLDGGICIITLFTIEDPMYEEIKLKNISMEDGGFNDAANNRKWYFPKPTELREIFKKDFEIIFYVEAFIEDKKGHPGNPQPHKHAIARMVAKK